MTCDTHTHFDATCAVCQAGCSCEFTLMRRPSLDCATHGRDCYECGHIVFENEGEQHGRAGWVHYRCIA